MKPERLCQYTDEQLERLKRWSLIVMKQGYGKKAQWRYSVRNPVGGSCSMGSFPSKEAALAAGSRMNDQAMREIENQGGLDIYRGEFMVTITDPDGKWIHQYLETKEI